MSPVAPQRVNYVARRNPRLSHDEWVRQWREHWQLAQSFAETDTIRRYTQCEVLFDTSSSPRDGFASAEYVSTAARERNRSAEAYHRRMREDERRIFDRIVAETMFIGDHHLLAGSGSGPFKIVRFVRRRPDVDPADFAAAWLIGHGRRVASSGSILGYAQNHPIEPDGPSGWGLAVDGAEEIWFASAASARDYLASEELAWADAESPVFEVIDAIVTDEVVLRDGD
ncbi:MAG: EthD domain-containing protein [Nocardioidaceae bacterium]